VKEPNGMEYVHDGLTYKSIYHMGHNRLKHEKKSTTFRFSLQTMVTCTESWKTSMFFVVTSRSTTEPRTLTEQSEGT